MKRLKKGIALLCITALLGTLAAGCGNTGNDGSKEAIELTIFQFQVETHDQLQATAESYTALNPNVTIHVETVGGGQDYAGSLRAKMSGNEQPDIIMLEGPSDLVEWQGYLDDLSDEPWAQDILPDLQDFCSIDGKILGFPSACVNYGLIYNKRIFADAGIDMDGVSSFDEIDAAFAALKQKIDAGEMRDKYPALEAVIEFPVKETWVTGSQASSLPLGLELGDPMTALAADSIDFTYSDAFKDYIDLQIRYTKNADNPSALNAVDYSAALGGGLSIERVAVIQMGQWIMPEVLAVNPELAENLGLLPAPMKGAAEGNIVMGGGGLWCVNKNSDDAARREAKAFLNWWQCTEEGLAEYADDVLLSGLKNPPLAPTNVISEAGLPYIEADNITSLVSTGYPQGWSDYLGEGIQSYVAGEIEWDDMIENAKAEWSRLRAK